jgi:methionyl-tRNA formyltransferase
VITANRPDAETRTELAAFAADIGVIVAYGALLDSEMLTLPARGWINLHFSALPEFRGAAPVQRALLSAASTIGTSVFQLVEEMDAGALFDVETHHIEPHQTSGEVLGTLAVSGAQQLVRVLDAIEAGGMESRPQEGSPSFAPKLTSHDARLDPHESAITTFNRFRAVTPEPGAWLETSSGRIKVTAAEHPSSERSHDAVPVPVGVIVERDGQVFLGVSDGALLLRRVTPAGKRDMEATEWLRGIRAGTVDVESS